MVGEWTQGLVDTMIDAFDPRVFLASHVAGGAVSRVNETATAFPHRNAEIMLVFVSIMERSGAGRCDVRQYTRALYNAIEPHMGGYYDNIDFDRDAATGNYGPAYTRLARIKGQYDPGNLFRMNSNIRPAG